jgi:sugar phosphate isomerase/epimerase
LEQLGRAALVPLVIPRRSALFPSAPGHAIGIQLYTVRSLMEKDVEGTLAALAGIGYREVELAGLHGKTPTEMRALLDRHGLSAPSAHIPLEVMRGGWPRALDDAATLGNRYVVCPWIDQSERTLDGYKRIAALFNAAGRAARRAGIQLAYHNHDFEFAPLGGTTGYEVLLAESDRDLVRMEMDLFWITKGGRDPLAYFERFPGRFPLVHVKDMAANGAMVDVGAGRIDFPRVFAQAGRAGIRHYFVEHDEPASPLDSARASFAYLERMSL